MSVCLRSFAMGTKTSLPGFAHVALRLLTIFCSASWAILGLPRGYSCYKPDMTRFPRRSRESETTSTRAEARMACRSSDEAVAAGEDLVGPKGANVKLAWGSGAVQAWLGSGSPGGGATF